MRCMHVPVCVCVCACLSQRLVGSNQYEQMCARILNRHRGLGVHLCVHVEECVHKCVCVLCMCLTLRVSHIPLHTLQLTCARFGVCSD